MGSLFGNPIVIYRLKFVAVTPLRHYTVTCCTSLEKVDMALLSLLQCCSVAVPK